MPENRNSPDEIRLLLALFDLGSQNIPKSKWLNLFKRKSETIKSFQPLVANLQQEGSITIHTEKSSQQVSLLPKGQSKLHTGLIDDQLVFPSNVVATKFAKALLHWIKTENSSPKIIENVHQIESYQDFKTKALQVYDRLNQDYKLDDLVPIYRIRRQIGEIADRHQFDEWLLEMQADDTFQLLEGSVEDSAPDKIADSVRTQLSGLRCYAKKLSSE
jgi:hypothetical protein